MAVSLTTCAPAASPKLPVQPASFVAGRILLVRPVTGATTDGPLHTVVFEDAGSAPQGELVEFIVRTDDGATQSIVQDNEPGFRAGDKVVILQGDRARLARPG
jgi:outer membrane lipoprotein SlyB